MTPKLYYSEDSPPVRATLLAIKALGIQVELKLMNLAGGDHMTPEFLKLNPLHTIPTLEDGNFVIWDSHAINTYLVGKYGRDDSLYPKDLQKRAIIDQRLCLDCGILFPGIENIVLPLLRDGAKTVTEEYSRLLVQGYTSLEALLERSTYVAGEQLSLADFSIIATVTSGNVLVPISPKKYPKILEWIARIKALPYYAEANEPGLKKFETLMKSVLT